MEKMIKTVNQRKILNDVYNNNLGQLYNPFLTCCVLSR